MQNFNVNISPELLEAYEDGSVVKAGGYFTVEHIREGEVIHTQNSENIVVDEGLNYILDAAMSGGTPLTSWYVGIFKNNYTPVFNDTAATFAGAGVANEVSTEVDESARPAWTEVGVSTKSITNAASPSEFNVNATVSVYGAFLISDNTMGGTIGTLCAASKFPSVRNLVNTDILNITYTLNIADA